MQPLKLTIPGKFWDSLIYKGRLYVFGRDGDIRIVNWDKLVCEWHLQDKLRVAMLCAFCRSDYLYGDRWSLLFSDEQVRELIQHKFEMLRKQELYLRADRLERFLVGRQDNDFPFPHTAATIYAETLYIASSAGLFRAKCNKKTKYPISTRIEKRWDCPISALAASYGTMALAAGDEGLFESGLNNDWTANRADPKQIYNENCVDCNWAFYSIYGSSHLVGGKLASFKKTTPLDGGFERELQSVISGTDIFSERGYSWGNQDKLCLAKPGCIRVVRYEPWTETKLVDIGSIEIDRWKGAPVSGRVALFGTVVEYDNALVVIPSGLGKIVTLRGEPVNWRVFPRSKHYENQLHVIYDDRLEIWSFNHDYFIDQKLKVAGITYRAQNSGLAA